MIEVTGVGKRYGAIRALVNASFACRPGRVHALLGENGAGKSTLVKVLSGMVAPDQGTIRMDGVPTHFASIREARAAGIGTAFQELSLVRRMTVAQNLFLGREPERAGFVDRRVLHQEAEGLLARYEVEGIDPDEDVTQLSLALRQKLEVVKALDHATRVCILDESTSALPAADVEWFLARVRDLRTNGVAVVFITHRLAEVRRFCDEITVLRHGQTVGTHAVSNVDDAQVIALMLGQPLSSAYPPRQASPPPGEEPLLAAEGLRRAPLLEWVSLTVGRGEIMGVAALQGQGQEALFRGLFGNPPFDAGTIRLDGQPLVIRQPRDAIRAGLGITYVPEERKTEGLFLKLSGADNLTIASLDRVSRFGWISARRERAAVEGMMDRLSIPSHAVKEPVEVLSGGNQQKVVLGKWLLRGAKVMLLYDPTRGVDVGTKREIYDIIQAHARSGGGVLWYSTDVLELVNVCDRILILYRGQVIGEARGDQTTSDQVLSAMLGPQEVHDR